MKKYSANYSCTNHNFVIQNLDDEEVKSEYLPAICILKNVLQRGTPTLMSSYLQEQLGAIQRVENFTDSIPLVDKEPPIWTNTIKGDEANGDNPALHFFNNLVPKYLSEFSCIQQLILPEAKVNTVTQFESNDYVGQEVDFYLPQALLVVEIDGLHHQEPLQQQKDLDRDAHLSNYGLKVVRIKTKDIREETTILKDKFQEIEKRINEVDETFEKQKSKKYIKGVSQYENFDTQILEDSRVKATAIVRFQILLLELLQTGKLTFDKPWYLEVKNHDISGYEQLAIDDLFIWFSHLLQLQKIQYSLPKINLTLLSKGETSKSSNATLRIDFSLLKRYTDEHLNNETIIYLRTDYLDHFIIREGDMYRLLPIDYFQISTTPDLFQYSLVKEDDEKSLVFFLWTLFLQSQIDKPLEDVGFREGQFHIIKNALSLHNTVGLLPTGSGKSVCYQISAMLQPAVSFVVCPIKSLMFDQKMDLDNAYISRSNHVSSDNIGAERERIQNNFKKGKYFFIFISPERFQNQEFRVYFRAVATRFNIAYAVIDEVHCLSEWGHDFRTSYLNLSTTINNLSPNAKYLGLTATASSYVLRDIKLEFGIESSDVMVPLHFGREELKFEVINDEGAKYPKLVETINELKSRGLAMTPEGINPCGIVFTNTVNGSNGCYNISRSLKISLESDVYYYSGSVPSDASFQDSSSFDKYKKQVQEGFKKNKFSLLTATKAFGMGINKSNIAYTVHYGIPGSMEALYQEAGRAGRNKDHFSAENPAECKVLLSPSNNSEIDLSQLWNPATNLDSLRALQQGLDGDINTNMFLLGIGMEPIKKEFEIIAEVLSKLSLNGGVMDISGNHLSSNNQINTGQKKSRTEKAIYRLKQLGVVEDWLVLDFFNGGRFKVYFKAYSDETLLERLKRTIRKYDAEFTFNDEKHKARYSEIINGTLTGELNTSRNKTIVLLLQWSYEHFVYNRRTSLKNVYESCLKFTSQEGYGSKEFKADLEAYFTFNEDSYILQHIADNPKDISKWFDVFYIITNGVVTKDLKSIAEMRSLRGMIRRILESYRENTAIDWISGLTMLSIDDFENTDGRVRFISAIEKSTEFKNEDRVFLLTKTLRIGSRLTEENRIHLGEILLKFYSEPKLRFEIAEALRTELAQAAVLSDFNSRLRNINKNLIK